MARKIQDIAPPKKLKRKVKEYVSPRRLREKGRLKSKIFSGWVRNGAVLLVVMLITVVGVIHIFFAKVEVSLWPETRVIKVVESIVAKVGQERLDREGRIIPARTIEKEKSGTRLFQASSKSIRENRASGTIRVFNEYSLSLIHI